MSSDQQFFLKWNDFQTNMVTSFRHLRDEKSFTDVSACLFCYYNLNSIEFKANSNKIYITGYTCVRRSDV